jgi:hypothetical protein
MAEAYASVKLPTISTAASVNDPAVARLARSTS